ncbi:MAG: hypothetical protein IH872_01425 [Chloroflexi bacterium]|nr:hypothetical protein [Chloroflexota bacterium]
MAVFSEFFEHTNFRGTTETFSLNNSYRYKWIKFGSGLGDEISSLRARAYSGYNGNVYGFTSSDFLGDFASLNMAEGWTCWWSNVGSGMNDDIESAIMINRNKSELIIPLKDQISGPFIAGLDEAVAGTNVSRNGDPRVYSLFWPSHDPSRKFVRIEQDLRVALDWWPDYDARVRYDVYLYLNSSGVITGYVAWTHTWVEGGIFSGDILDELHPKLVEGASTLTEEIQSQLALVTLLAAFGGYSFKSLYLLPAGEPPMPPPSSNFGSMGSATDDSTLVLTL